MKMSSHKLEVAVVGLGVGEQHARAYARNNSCILRWVYDLNSARTHQVIAELGQGMAAENFETLLADRSVNIISIASYDDMHAGQSCTALRAGKHVFVEKPLCRSLEELCAIKSVWQAGDNLQLSSNLVLRAAPLYIWLRDTIQEGRLGEIFAYDGDYLFGRIHKITEGWRKDVDDYSVMQGGGIHLVDLMLWLTGQRPMAVTAVGNRICTAGTAFRYHDYVSAMFQFPSGMIGRITANFGCVHRHQHVIRVFGTNGTFIYDDQGPRLHTSRDPSVPATALELSPLPANKGDLIPGFIKAILDGGDRQARAQQEFDTISVCIAADQALTGAKPMEIEYI